MANIFFGKSKKQPLIVEVCARGMGAMVLVDNNGEFLLEKVWYQPWSFRLIYNQEDFFANFEKVLPSFISAFPVKQYTLTLCMGDSSNRIRFTQTPVVEDEEELEEMLLARKLMPAQEKYMSEAHLIGPSISDTKTSQDVLIHSVNRELAQTIMDYFEEKGYELEAFEYPANAHIAFQNYYCEQGRTENEIMISIGWETSSLSIFHQGKLRFAHSLNYRLFDLVMELIQKMEMSENDAIALVRKGFFATLLQPSAGVKVQIQDDILQEAKAQLEYLMENIRQCLVTYASVCCEWQIEGVQRVVCCGVETDIEPLYNYIVSWLKLPAISLKPVETISHGDDAKIKLGEPFVIENMVTAFGLALRTFEAE